MDAVMHCCMDRKIIIYGYGYSGRFVAWYAEYYHSIKPNYLITEEYTNIIPYEYPLFRNSLFDFGYKDVKDAIVWLCTQETGEIREILDQHGYIKNKTYYNMNQVIYGEKYDIQFCDTNIQFMRYLEKVYNCDVVEPIQVANFTNTLNGMRPCVNLSPKEIFPILDKCHCHPQEKDAIFDFGCGKGAALLSFLDYGIMKVGGVEYVDNVYQILISNFEKLGIDLLSGYVNCFHGDAALLKNELDDYNWFYLFDPFDEKVLEKVLGNLCESIKRYPRKIWIIYIIPKYHELIMKTERFVLTNQFDIMTRQRVVNIYISKEGK